MDINELLIKNNQILLFHYLRVNKKNDVLCQIDFKKIYI